MKKRIALKILKNRDRLRYKPSQIEEAMKVAARYGIRVEEAEQSAPSGEDQAETKEDA